MNRSDLQILADARIVDAKALLDAGRWSAAYYLLGYAVECALKACAAKQFREHEIPEKTLINDFYTHQFDKLLQISGTRRILEDQGENDRLRRNWSKVLDWKETARYNHSTTEAQAREMFAAVCDPTSGVLTWLKTLW